MLLHDSRRAARVGRRRPARPARRPGPRALGPRGDRRGARADRARAGARRPRPLRAAGADRRRARARPARRTDWAAIAGAYDAARRDRPEPGGRAQPRGRGRDGAAARRPAWRSPTSWPSALDGYHLLHAARADLLRRLGPRATRRAAAYRARAASSPATRSSATFLDAAPAELDADGGQRSAGVAGSPAGSTAAGSSARTARSRAAVPASAHDRQPRSRARAACAPMSDRMHRTNVRGTSTGVKATGVSNARSASAPAADRRRLRRREQPVAPRGRAPLGGRVRADRERGVARVGHQPVDRPRARGPRSRSRSASAGHDHAAVGVPGRRTSGAVAAELRRDRGSACDAGVWPAREVQVGREHVVAGRAQALRHLAPRPRAGAGHVDEHEPHATAATVSAVTGRAAPRSVTSAHTSSAGVTSNAGLRQRRARDRQQRPAGARTSSRVALLDLDRRRRSRAAGRPRTTGRRPRTGSAPRGRRARARRCRPCWRRRRWRRRGRSR